MTNKVDKIKNTNLSNSMKDELINSIINNALDKYDDEVTFTPRSKYIEQALKSNRESAILNLVDELKKELNKLLEGDK